MVKISKKVVEKAKEDRREAMLKIEPLFVEGEQVDIKPVFRNGQAYFLLEIDREVEVDSRDIADCVRKAKQISNQRKGIAPASGKDKKPAPGKLANAFAGYMGLVREVSAKMTDVDTIPDAVMKAAQNLFGVKLAATYLKNAPNPGVMKMRACNTIASQLFKAVKEKAAKSHRS